MGSVGTSQQLIEPQALASAFLGSGAGGLLSAKVPVKTAALPKSETSAIGWHKGGPWSYSKTPPAPVAPAAYPKEAPPVSPPPFFALGSYGQPGCPLPRAPTIGGGGLSAGLGGRFHF